MKANLNPALTGYIAKLSRMLTETDMLDEARFFEAMDARHERIEKASANAMGRKPALYRGLLDSDFLLEEVNDGSIEDTREPKRFIPTEEITEADLNPLYLTMTEADEESEDETEAEIADAAELTDAETEDEMIESFLSAEPAKAAPTDRYAALAVEFGVSDGVADHAYARVRNGNDYLAVVPKKQAAQAPKAADDVEDVFAVKYGDDFGPTRVKMTRTSLDSRSESNGSLRHRSVNIYRRQKRLPKGGATVRRDPGLTIKVAAVSNVALVCPKGIARTIAKRFGVKVINVHGFSVIAD